MSDTTNRMVFWGIVGLVIAGSIAVVVRGGGTESTGNDTTERLTGSALEINTTVEAGDWVKGSDENKMILVEYSDFQCPACAQAAPVANDIVTEFGNHLTFVYRHYPLQSIHPNAFDAARAAEAAGLQGQFYEMHDKLFDEQSTWSDVGNPDDLFASYAEEIGLDKAQFEADYASDAVEDAVDAQIEMGQTSGVNSTPTFFLDGERIQPRNYEDFRATVREAIKGDDHE